MSGDRNAPPAKRFVTTEYVRWSDIDYARIMRYSAYPRFLELAEAELFRSLGVQYHELFTRFGISLPRRTMHFDFHGPARLDDQLELAAWFGHMGATSLRFDLEIRQAASRELVATGQMVLVCTAVEVLEKRPIPEELRALIAPYTAGQGRG